jgi:hypothetical protein
VVGSARRPGSRHSVIGVGLRLHSNSARRVNAALYGEIGGFGLGSDLEWQIFPVVDVRVLERCRWSWDIAG